VGGILEYPLKSPDEITAEAWAAMARQENEQALLLWQRLRQHFPERPEGHIRAAQLLWQAGRLDEAEAMAAEAGARFPEDPDVFVQHAWIAMLRQHWDEALRWWTAARERAPDRPDAYIWAARALWQSERLDEATEFADQALARFPDNLDAQAECAWVAVARRDWEDSLRRWTALVERSPDRADAHIGTLQGLRMLGRLDEAEAMGRSSVERFPDNTDVMTEHVWTAVAREDWPAAAARLEAVRGKLQDAGRFEASLGWVEYRVRSQLAGDGRGGGAPGGPSAAGGDVVPETADATATTDLMLAFESLGERCDFGAVQRKFGVEPLGLLRFAYTRYDPLITALEDRFAAVGTEEDTSFELFGDENIVYMRKYGVIFHTFVYQKELPTEEKRRAFRQQQRRRLAFLRNKLVADLDEQQKIYIYSSDDRTSPADMNRLLAALRAYGPNSLLYVIPATEAHPAGTVETLEDGLYAGYYGGFADFLKGEQPPFELWRQLCERTHRLARKTPA
jgi:tetratricopeptide (TPR) repeat protein